MATLCRAYTSEQHAYTAVERLVSAGIAGAEVQVLMGETAHDTREAPIGSYVGTTTGVPPVSWTLDRWAVWPGSKDRCRCRQPRRIPRSSVVRRSGC